MSQRGRSPRTMTAGAGSQSQAQLAMLKSVYLPDAGVFIDLGSQAALRRCLEALVCPFCERSYKALLVHIRRSHGYSKNEMKELAGVTKSASFVDSTTSAKIRTAVHPPRTSEEMRVVARAPRALSSAAAAQYRQHAARVGTGRSREELDTAYAEMRRLSAAGVRQKDIAMQLGYSDAAVSRALNRSA